MNFPSIQVFRETATEQDAYDLRDYIFSQKRKVDAFPCEKYNFSYSSAAKYLKEVGLWKNTRKKAHKEEKPNFFIVGERKTDFVSRSFCIQKDILERFDKISADHWQYSKKAIINKILNDGLKKYGY